MNHAELGLFKAFLCTVSTTTNKLYHFSQPHKLLCKMGIGPKLWIALCINWHDTCKVSGTPHHLT